MPGKISRFILSLVGWEVVIEEKPLPPKFVAAVVPHTSNWDFPLGLLTRNILGVAIKYVAKDSLFKPPFGFLFYWLGGYPVDRSKRQHFVDSVVDIFNEKEKFAIVLAPEGTRKKVNQLKTGFYFIAKKAKVPILLVKFDYGNKKVVVGKPFFPSSDVNADFEYINAYFRGVKGKRPDRSF